MHPILPSNRHIRLLWVLPESDQDKRIHCSLQVVGLDSRPLFDCLSYTWLNPLGLSESSQEFQEERRNPLSERIVCDGEPLAVSRNLFQCLQFFQKRGLHVRSEDGAASSARPIWIDAVCINQKDEGEKPDQILMMSDIYARAHRVLVWLGPGDKYTPCATSVIDKLASVANGISGLQYYDLDDEDPCPILGIEPSISREEWLSYATLLRRAWFSRVWVAQESYFAKSIAVFCGEIEILWKSLVRSAKVLQETGLAEALEKMTLSNIDFETIAGGSPHFSHESELDTASIDSFSPMRSSLNNQFILTIFGGEGEKASFSLDRLLSYSCYLDAGEAPDKVFGLRGIWQDSGPAQKLQDLVPVDYKSSVPDVFMNATYTAISEMKDLNILRLVGQPHSTQFKPSNVLALPSWVPDYTRWPQLHNITIRKGPPAPDTNQNDTISRCKSGAFPHKPEAECYGSWRADGGRAHAPDFDRQSKCLTVKGILFEAIVDVGPFYRQIDSSHKLHLLLRHLGRFPSSPSPYGLDASIAWLHVLVAGEYRGQPAIREAIQAFHDLIAVFVRELEEAWNFSDFEELPEASELKRLYEQTKDAIDDLSTRQSNRDVIPDWEEVQRLIEISHRGPDDEDRRRMDSDTDAIRQSFDRAYMGRRIFRTTGNHWGISSESLKEDDHVCVLSGADTPYVLRKSSGGWSVIGEAYVHGIMHGEAAHGSFRDMKLE
ncbi:heterokaryon incompatibility protein-domain-containing protein [Nemania abortiva]|nr:heterokaryon incompatibility protein-domain-containing protein [Nemania abortiva]